MMNRPGFIREWNGLVAHKGYYDRQGQHFFMTLEIEQRIVDEECGNCLVSFYQMPLRLLTDRVLDRQ